MFMAFIQQDMWLKKAFMTYTKLPISITDQITLLKSRELIFADEAYAAKVLEPFWYTFKVFCAFAPIAATVIRSKTKIFRFINGQK